jgi:hypothetical protein
VQFNQVIPLTQPLTTAKIRARLVPRVIGDGFATRILSPEPAFLTFTSVGYTLSKCPSGQRAIPVNIALEN